MDTSREDDRGPGGMHTAGRLAGVALMSAFDALLSSNRASMAAVHADHRMTADEATDLLERLRQARASEAAAAAATLQDADADDDDAPLDVPKFARAQLEARARLAEATAALEKKQARRADTDAAMERILEAMQTLCVEGEERDVVISIVRAARNARIDELDIEESERERAAFAELVAEGLPLLRAAHQALLPPTAAADAEASAASALCPVCYERNVEFAMAPCGHTLCGVCRGRMLPVVGSSRPGKCHVCRDNVQMALRVYLNN